MATWPLWLCGDQRGRTWVRPPQGRLLERLLATNMSRDESNHVHSRQPCRTGPVHGLPCLWLALLVAGFEVLDVGIVNMVGLLPLPLPPQLGST